MKKLSIIILLFPFFCVAQTSIRIETARELKLLFPFFCVAQTSLSGTYTIVKKQRGFVNDIFSFDKNGAFTMMRTHCEGANIGNGKYVVKNDTLILSFEKNRYLKPKNYAIKKRKDLKDKTAIKIQAFDMNYGETFPGVSCALKNTSIGAVTDIDGICEIRSDYMISQKDTLVISVAEYSNVEIPLIKEIAQSEMIIQMDYSKYYWSSGEFVKFLIVKNKAKLVMKGYDTGKKDFTKENYSFKKTRKINFTKAIESRFNEN